MFIQTEETPNPATLKFIPDGQVVLESGTAEFKSQAQAATKSPLALQILEISGTNAVFFGRDFVTVTKGADAEWSKIKPEILATIIDFYVSGKPIMFAVKDEDKSSDSEVEDSEVVKQIKELIEVKVRPAVAMDGGDIVFDSFEDGIVRLQLKGACSGCPSSTITLKSGIENMLKHYIPEVMSVEQVEEY